ncbi:hypothetical protein [Granulicella aggregans]|uniref:hypothetical protein n=1 Tax=Granulicella aggregans TaxID=474949 RepID=UPI0021E0211B|nr:hypothetical protein [Granulicella aggregans]
MIGSRHLWIALCLLDWSLSSVLPAAAQLHRYSGDVPVVDKTSGDEVLVYYASETAAQGPTVENAHIIAGWLRQIDTPDAHLESSAILKDIDVFPGVIQEEIAALRKDPNHGNFLLFSNDLTRQGHLWLGRRGKPAVLADFHCQAVENPDPLIAYSPLSTSNCLTAALREAATQFRVDQHTFTVVLNGHGYQERSLVPRLCVWHNEITPDVLARIFHRVDLASARNFRARYGMSKQELVDTLGTSVPDMHIRLVELHSCHSSLPQGAHLPKNVDVLWAYDGNVNYKTIDYERVLANAPQAGPSEAFDSYFLRIQRRDTLIDWYKGHRAFLATGIWFVPLLVYISGYLFFLMRRSFASRHPLPQQG